MLIQNKPSLKAGILLMLIVSSIFIISFISTHKENITGNYLVTAKASSTSSRGNRYEGIYRRNFLSTLLLPDERARAVAEMLDAAGIDITEWVKVDLGALGLDGIIEWRCKPRKDIHIIPAKTFGIYSTIGYPNFKTMILHAQGERLEYKKIEWTQCSEEKWFPIKTNEGVKPLGYLYKFSFYIKHPYSAKDVEDMDIDEREKLGLDRHGNINYQVKIKGEICSKEFHKNYNKILPNIGEDKMEEEFVLPPGESDFRIFSFYELAKIKKICIKFDTFKLDDKGELCFDVISKTKDKIENFVYLPEHDPDAGETGIPMGVDKQGTPKLIKGCNFPGAYCG